MKALKTALEAGAAVDAANRMRWTALHRAVTPHPDPTVCCLCVDYVRHSLPSLWSRQNASQPRARVASCG